MRIAIRNPWLVVLTLLSAVGCHTPTPNDLVLLDIPGNPRFALSTEDGILALAGDELTGEIPAIQYWKGREIRDDLNRPLDKLFIMIAPDEWGAIVAVIPELASEPEPALKPSVASAAMKSASWLVKP